jgi:hypothetical protein
MTRDQGEKADSAFGVWLTYPLSPVPCPLFCSPQFEMTMTAESAEKSGTTSWRPCAGHNPTSFDARRGPYRFHPWEMEAARLGVRASWRTDESHLDSSGSLSSTDFADWESRCAGRVFYERLAGGALDVLRGRTFSTLQCSARRPAWFTSTLQKNAPAGVWTNKKHKNA